MLSSEFRVRNVWFLQSGSEKWSRKEAGTELEYHRAFLHSSVVIVTHLISAGFSITSD